MVGGDKHIRYFLQPRPGHLGKKISHDGAFHQIIRSLHHRMLHTKFPFGISKSAPFIDGAYLHRATLGLDSSDCGTRVRVVAQALFERFDLLPPLLDVSITPLFAITPFLIVSKKEGRILPWFAPSGLPIGG